MIIKMSLCFNIKITGVYLSVIMEALSNLNLMLLSFAFFFFRTPHSARELLMENPPKLSDEVLQRLLSEAQTALPSRLSTLREEDEDG